MRIIARAAERAKPTTAAKVRRQRRPRRPKATATLPGIRVRWSAALPYEGAPPEPYCDLSEQPVEVKMHCETAVEEFIKRTGMRPTELTIAVIATCEIPGA